MYQCRKTKITSNNYPNDELNANDIGYSLQEQRCCGYRDCASFSNSNDGWKFKENEKDLDFNITKEHKAGPLFGPISSN